MKIQCERGQPLLVVDIECVCRRAADEFVHTLGAILREARLQQAVLHWRHFDALLAEERRRELATFEHALAEWPGLSLCGGEQRWHGPRTAAGIRPEEIVVPAAAVEQRHAVWQRALAAGPHAVTPGELADLAAAFRLTHGQIVDIVMSARQHSALWSDASTLLDARHLYDACRSRATHALGVLARKIQPAYRWENLVLASDSLKRLRELCDQFRYRDKVYDEWGFGRSRLSGRGLAALFAGPSGTGKTMSAEIIAGELGLELYRIDLSQVVSKYIGDTEKNLGRVFAEAERANAVLFFDEADALFGKRSEVRDAHDRYANIETGYLLQRMEEYDGVMILATNFRKNMDEAFVRRLQFVIDFPYPTVVDRVRLWRNVWPRQASCPTAVDMQRLAERFEITGGNIRNIAVAAAFMAAADGGPIGLPHLLAAARREHQKMGKLVDENDFAPLVWAKQQT